MTDARPSISSALGALCRLREIVFHFQSIAHSLQCPPSCGGDASARQPWATGILLDPTKGGDQSPWQSDKPELIDPRNEREPRMYPGFPAEVRPATHNGRVIPLVSRRRPNARVRRTLFHLIREIKGVGSNYWLLSRPSASAKRQLMTPDPFNFARLIASSLNVRGWVPPNHVAGCSLLRALPALQEPVRCLGRNLS